MERVDPTADELPNLARMLSHAFAEDAHVNWLLRPGSGGTAPRDALFLFLLARMGGELHATGDRHAAALWYPPGIVPDWRRQTRFFLSLLGLAGPVRAIRRGLDLKRMDGLHPAAPHYYLQLLGTEPGYRGAGRAGVLLRRLLALAEAAGRQVYLETSSRDNVVYYQGHGFSPVAETVLSGGLRLHSLVWKPAG